MNGSDRVLLDVIVNPVSGRLKKTNALEKVRALLQKKEIPFEVHYTQGRGHSTELAKSAVGQGRDILLMSGDGTLSEVVGSVIFTNSTLYIAPCGTGNDFVKALGLPLDPEEAVRLQLEGTPCQVDACMMNDRSFVNVFGTGFDVEVLRETEQFKKKGMTGIMPYMLGIVKAIKGFKPQEMTVTVDGKTVTQKITIIAAANGQYFGGGMRVSPYSDIQDGLLDVNYVDGVTKPVMIRLLPSFVTGAFTKSRYTHMTKTREIVIERKGMTVDIDGELIDTDRARVRILPSALNMCLPPKRGD